MYVRLRRMQHDLVLTVCVCVCVWTGAGKDSKVGVEGDSAGGKLAASVAHDVQGLSFQVNTRQHYH